MFVSSSSFYFSSLSLSSNCTIVSMCPVNCNHIITIKSMKLSCFSWFTNEILWSPVTNHNQHMNCKWKSLVAGLTLHSHEHQWLQDTLYQHPLLISALQCQLSNQRIQSTVRNTSVWSQISVTMIWFNRWIINLKTSNTCFKY